MPLPCALAARGPALCAHPIHHARQRILGQANESVFDRLAAFCQESTAAPLPGAMQSPFEEVPTALLLTGINTPDHDPVFARLVQRIHVRR